MDHSTFEGGVGDLDQKIKIAYLYQNTNAYTQPLYWRIKVNARSESPTNNQLVPRAHGNKNIIHAYARENFPSV